MLCKITRGVLLRRTFWFDATALHGAMAKSGEVASGVGMYPKKEPAAVAELLSNCTGLPHCACGFVRKSNLF